MSWGLHPAKQCTRKFPASSHKCKEVSECPWGSGQRARHPSLSLWAPSHCWAMVARDGVIIGYPYLLQVALTYAIDLMALRNTTAYAIVCQNDLHCKVIYGQKTDHNRSLDRRKIGRASCRERV